MSIVEMILIVLMFIWDLFLTWLQIFIAPLKNLEMLWIIVPIWLNWFFSEFFQEKKGTSLGNAVTNGGMMVWVGIDWIRFMIRMIDAGSLRWGLLTAGKFALAALACGIGTFIVIEGIRTKRFVHFVGRVRQTTYLLVMFSPIIYGVVQLSWKVFIAMILFSPLFYYIIEAIDAYMPNPKTYDVDEAGEDKPRDKRDGFGRTQDDAFKDNSFNDDLDDDFEKDFPGM